MDRNKSIPSMFHRRLLLLGAACVITSIVLTAQMFRLGVVEGSERRAAAEAKLDRRTFLPTYRGCIYDRHGRVLALDRASQDVAVEYDVITGAWANSQAALAAKKELGRSRWGSMSPVERQAAISERLPHWKQRIERLWSEICRVGRISPDELQRRLDAIKADVMVTAAAFNDQQFMRERELFGISEEEYKAEPVREQNEAHVILPRVPDEIAFEFNRLAIEFPDMIEVRDSRRREYPWLEAEVPLSRISLPRQIRHADPIAIRVTGIADHILGAVRDEVWAEDVARRPFMKGGAVADLGGYDWRGDIVGARGLERAFEDYLRGMRGEIRERRDTMQRTRTDPKPGGDLRLTLDIALQARVQAILSNDFGLTKVQPWHHNAALPLGTPLNASAVVIEVETGEILALVSMPTIAMGAAMNDEQKKFNQPLVNRAVEAVYPPGSIIKPLVLSAAVMENLHNLGAAIKCTGYYYENNQTAARCWIYREKYGMNTHEALLAPEALARSCNIFFYTLGDRLGMEREIKWFRNFGLGEALDVGLRYSAKNDKGELQWLGESAGDLPTAERIAQMKRDGQLAFGETIMGIGQGPITWTPVQAANAYATLARSGTIRDATLLLDDPRPTRRQRCPDLKFSRALVDAALDGLRQSVMEDYGTGHHITYEADHSREAIINAVGVTAWAKTGTAQAIKSKGIDHSWFVGLVGPKGGQPMHAIAVIVENGGSGGRCAGPVANQIIRALQAEAYLPGDANAAPADALRGQANVEPEDDGGDE